MKKMTNVAHCEGRIYSHSLEIKTVSNQASKNYGKEFISGKINIATDNACCNVVTMEYTFITPTTSTGKADSRWTTLKQIIDNGKTVEANGKDNATVVRVTGSLALNEFFTKGTDSNEESLVQAKKNDASFIDIIPVEKLNPDENKRNTFEVDMYINNIRKIDANEERNIPADYIELSGAIFNFKNDYLPVTFKVKDVNGIKFFEAFDIAASNPVFTKVWGNIISESISVERVEEAGFGEAKVNVSERKNKEYVITGTQKAPYEFDDEKTLTKKEIDECVAKMQTRIAEIKAKREAYLASKDAVIPNSGKPLDFAFSSL